MKILDQKMTDSTTPAVKNTQTHPTETIFIVEDDPHQSDYLTVLLESAHYNVKTYTEPDAFLNNCQPDQRGCVISDMLMPGMTGLEMLNSFSKYNITLPVIFITSHADIAMVKTALKQGAVDFLEKPVNTVELLTAVQDALNQDAQIHARIQQIEATQSRLKELTAREREILDLLVAGHSNKQLARQLDLSLRTVETHRNNILKKMSVGSFSELLRMLLASPEPHSA